MSIILCETYDLCTEADRLSGEKAAVRDFRCSELDQSQESAGILGSSQSQPKLRTLADLTSKCLIKRNFSSK